MLFYRLFLFPTFNAAEGDGGDGGTRQSELLQTFLLFKIHFRMPFPFIHPPAVAAAPLNNYFPCRARLLFGFTAGKN